ncbi:hypothetical protein FB451DRAFT_1498190 [Mycena latifolia]|nr:hypothetical protein FB451DRAFT_1498190 [Mycena latifolia]
MPNLKRKKKQKLQEDHALLPPDSPRPLSPMSIVSDNHALSDHGSNHHVSDDGSSILSELSEDLDDIPHFESEGMLLRWLDLGKEKVKKLIENLKPKGNTSGAHGQIQKSRGEEKQKGAWEWLAGVVSASIHNQCEDQATDDAGIEGDVRPAPVLDPIPHGPGSTLTIEEIEEEEGMGDWDEIFATLDLDQPDIPDVDGPSKTLAATPLPPSASLMSLASAAIPGTSRYTPGHPTSFSRAD